MQVYRGMDIGTAKPDAATRARIPHHMVDVVEPEVEFSVREFQTRARAVLDDSGARFVIAGGSGLHFRAVVDPMEFAPTDPEVRDRIDRMDTDVARDRLVAVDSEAGSHVDLANPRRVARALEIHELTGETPTRRSRNPQSSAVAGYEALIEHHSIGIDAGEVAHVRAEQRWNAMIERGLVDEVASLVGRMSRTAAQAVGYKELLPVVAGETTLEEASEDALAATRGLIKRQRTYFRRDPRIAWMPWHDDAETRIADVVREIEEVAGWTS